VAWSPMALGSEHGAAGPRGHHGHDSCRGGHLAHVRARDSCIAGSVGPPAEGRSRSAGECTSSYLDRHRPVNGREAWWRVAAVEVALDIPQEVSYLQGCPASERLPYVKRGPGRPGAYAAARVPTGGRRIASCQAAKHDPGAPGYANSFARPGQKERAMSARGDVMLADRRGLGYVQVDPHLLRGETVGPDSRLVVPIDLHLRLAPEDKRMAVLHIQASLHVDAPISNATRIGPEVLLAPERGEVGWVTHPVGALHRIEVRFHLGNELFNHLDARRHSAGEKALPLYLRILPTVAWLRVPRTSNALGPQTTSEIGMACEVLRIWVAEPAVVRLEIDPATWIDKVLAPMGLHRSRLVEVPFPNRHHFDRARAALEKGDYPAAASACRRVLGAWESDWDVEHGGHRLAEAVAASMAWPAEDPRARALSLLWTGLQRLVERAVPESGSGVAWSGEDAELCFLLTAVVSAYLGHLDARR